VSAAMQARIPRLLDPVECSAYDYVAQKWITGPEARALRAKQIAETIALLESPKGREYADFIGIKPCYFCGHLESLKDQLSKLRR